MIVIICFVITQVLCHYTSHAQIAYYGYLSELRVKELHNLVDRLNYSINHEKYACESFYDYVCSNHNPLFSVMGQLPDTSDLMKLLTELQNDPDTFSAKTKLMHFFVSCTSNNSVNDCYRQSFEYFKPMFGYIIIKNYIDSSTHYYNDFLNLLDEFIVNARNAPNLHYRMQKLRENFSKPSRYFGSGQMTHEYRDLQIFADGYKYNLRNLEQHRKRNSTYRVGMQRTILDWTLYTFQSRDKPMSYFYSTMKVHLWMSLYNITERYLEPKHFVDRAECLRLPQYVNALDEARILGSIYLESFRRAWTDYENWVSKSIENQNIFSRENSILGQYHWNNYRLFFTLYAQNFCDFGKELAENVFYLGLRDKTFYDVYSCGFRSDNVKTNC